jgi:hypothetical protein
MAPLSFDDRLNVASLVGTWLGSLFTLVGLLAVITKLRVLLRDFSDHSQERLQDAAGDYAVCFKNLKLNEGVVEGKAPLVVGWIRHYYSNNKDIVITQFERGLAGGQASWSKLFARLQIQPQELIRYGGHDAIPTIIGKDAWWIRHRQLDLLVDGRKISYGMDGAEFAALLILSSFSPSTLSLNETSTTIGHLGQVYLGHHGPFSQIAQFDVSPKELSELQGVESPGRHAHRLNVRNCIDLALGIFRFECRGDFKDRVVILCLDQIERAQNVGGILETTYIRRCFGTPSASRLLVVRRNLVYLLNGYSDHDDLFDLTQATDFLFHDMFQTGNWHITFPEISEVVPFIDGEPIPDLFESLMRIAVTVRAIKPWGLPAIHPLSLTEAICPLLQRTFPASSNKTITLIRKFRELPQHCRFDIPGWNRMEMDQELNSLRTITSQNFSGLSSRGSLYYDAMAFVFSQHGRDLGSVSTGLAAWCATCYLYRESYPKEREKMHWFAYSASNTSVRFRAAIRERLNGSPLEELENWAYEILATYLIAWLRGSNPVEEDFRSNFRRRVFLG